MISSGDTFTLTDGQSISIKDIPKDLTYSVVEKEYIEYDTTAKGNQGTIVADETSFAFFTNEYIPQIPQYPEDEVPDPNDPESPEIIEIIDDKGKVLGTFTKVEDDCGNMVYADQYGNIFDRSPDTGENNNLVYLWIILTFACFCNCYYLWPQKSNRQISLFER